MRFKAVSVLLGAVVASSFSAPVKFGAGSPADAADALPQPPPPLVKVPEFVPVINFSEFVMAVQTFAAANPSAGDIAAEALSAKFASDTTSQQASPPPTVPHQQQAAAEPVKAAPVPVVVSHPVVVAEVPPVPDPTESLPQVADPVKVVTGYPDTQAEAQPQSQTHPQPRRHKVEKKAEKKVAETTSSRPRLERKFRPAMGLGMTVDSAEEMPPPSSFARPAKTVYRWDGSSFK